MIKETFDKFTALIKGLNDDAVKDAFVNFQKSLEYCIEENINIIAKNFILRKTRRNACRQRP
jgi:hypothetical protein